MIFSLNISNNKEYENKVYEIEFSMIGIHNIQNALATIATGIELKIPLIKIKNTLKKFYWSSKKISKSWKFKILLLSMIMVIILLK